MKNIVLGVCVIFLGTLIRVPSVQGMVEGLYCGLENCYDGIGN